MPAPSLRQSDPADPVAPAAHGAPGGSEIECKPHADDLAFARQIMRDEAQAIERTAAALGPGFAQAVELICACAQAGGTVLISGLGKSGLIGSKISASMASLGIPSHHVHPTEAAHGDLGRFRSQDLAICLSHSGETDEIVGLASTLRQDGIRVIAITRGGPAPNALERNADVAISTHVEGEAGGGFSLAPTNSTTVTLAIGDALALCAARRRAFTDADFYRRHPGGQLGGFLRPVVELLRFKAGENLPVVDAGLTVTEALAVASRVERRPGALLVVAPDTRRLVGIFTDSDLRRLVVKDPDALGRPIDDVMTPSPRTLDHTALARDAVRMVREHRQDEIPVVDADEHPIGLLDVQDLIAMKLVKD